MFKMLSSLGQHSMVNPSCILHHHMVKACVSTGHKSGGSARVRQISDSLKATVRVDGQDARKDMNTMVVQIVINHSICRVVPDVQQVQSLLSTNYGSAPLETPDASALHAVAHVAIIQKLCAPIISNTILALLPARQSKNPQAQKKQRHTALFFPQTAHKSLDPPSVRSETGSGVCNPGIPKQWRRDRIPALCGGARGPGGGQLQHQRYHREQRTWTLADRKFILVDMPELADVMVVLNADALGVILSLLRAYERSCREFRKYATSRKDVAGTAVSGLLLEVKRCPGISGAGFCVPVQS